MYAVPVVDVGQCAIERFGHSRIVGRIREAEALVEANICYGVHGEEVGLGAIVDRQIGRVDGVWRFERLRAGRVEALDQSSDLIRDLVFPVLQVLDGVRARKHLSLLSVVGLVHHVCQMEMCAGKDLVHVVFRASRAVPVNVLISR